MFVSGFVLTVLVTKIFSVYCLLIPTPEVLLSLHATPSVVCLKSALTAVAVEFAPLAEPVSAAVGHQGQKSVDEVFI